MALITCPECGKEVSDKCEQCIHCGYPLINTKCNINGIIYDFKEELPIVMIDDWNISVKALSSIVRRTSLSFADGNELFRTIRELKAVPSSFIPQYPLENTTNSHKVECPYCHSTDTKKISNTSKAVHTAMFGLLSASRNSRQWHCNKCGSDF